MAHNNIAAVVPQESTADNDNPSALRPKHYILPDGTPAFIRSEATSPCKRVYRLGRKRWSPGKVVGLCNLRLYSIGALIQGRHGGPCDTDDGEMYYSAAVRMQVMRWAAMTDDGRNPRDLNSQAWAQEHCPKLAADRPRAWFEDQERRILEELGAKHATVPAADDIARDLNIRHAEVVQFKLRSVGAVDRDARQREVERRRADVKRKALERRKNGDVMPRNESMAQTKPWLALNPPISRATYYRKVEKGELPKDPNMRRLRPKKRA